MLNLLLNLQFLSLIFVFTSLIKYSNCNVIKNKNNEEDLNMIKDLNSISKYSDQNYDTHFNYLIEKTSLLLEKLLKNKIKNKLLNFVETSDENESYGGEIGSVYEDENDDDNDSFLLRPTKRGLHVKHEMKPIRKSDGSIVWVATDKNKHYFIGK
jgi:hypothetical protein